MKNNQIILFLLLLILLNSCFKEDEAVTPFDRGDRQTDTIAMHHDYSMQVYFDLDSDKVVSQNHKVDYDLAFESTDDGHHILLNTATFMQIAQTGTTDFESVTSSSGLDFSFDPSSGNLDSTAIGNWFTINGQDSIFHQQVYVIDRGFDAAGNPLGFRKIVFERLQADYYHFRYAQLDGTDEVKSRLNKRDDYNFVYYSFDPDKNQPLLEPARNTYCLLFTQYTTLLFTQDNVPYPYLVTGVFLNRYNTEVAVDKTHGFEEIDIDFANAMQFTGQIDRIGYNWKDLVGDFESNNILYEVRSDYNYVIRDHQGFYYKLRFVGFYNADGQRGYPVIEHQRL